MIQGGPYLFISLYLKSVFLYFTTLCYRKDIKENYRLTERFQLSLENLPAYRRHDLSRQLFPLLNSSLMEKLFASFWPGFPL